LRFTSTAIPTFPHPTLCVGDFNCHHVNWGYSTTFLDGESLDSWASSNKLGLLHKPEEVAGISHRRNVDTNPDLTFASVVQDSRLPDRRVLGKFPMSQHLRVVVKKTHAGFFCKAHVKKTIKPTKKPTRFLFFL